MEASAKPECAICMVELCGTSGQGCPNKHAFHVVCILEWLKRERSCPLCRQHISCLTINEAGCGRSLIELPPTPPRTPVNPEIENMRCEVCRTGENEAQLLLCDSCDNCYHMGCLSPPLSAVPDGYWYCPQCERERAAHAPSSQAASSRVRRQITRTALSQNVRSSLRNLVNPDAEEPEESDYSDEEEDEEEEELEVEDGVERPQLDSDQDDFVLDARDQPGPSRRPVPRIPTRGRRMKKRKRKTAKRGKGKRTKRTEKRRTTKRRSVVSARSAASSGTYGSVYKRLAEATNLNLKTSTCYNVKALSEKSRGRMEPLGGTLNLFKSDVDEYISESDSDDLELTSGARRFDRPLFGPPRTAQEEVSQKADTPDSSLGLLDSILENQTKTLAPGSYLKIRRDGTLEERKEMKEYRKKIEDKLSNHPAFQQLRRQLYNERNASSMSMQNENPSTSLANTLGVSNGKSPKKSRWEPAQSRSSGKNNLNESSSGSPLPTTRISTLPRPALFSPQMHRNTPLLPMQPYLGALADVVNAPPPPPPPVMPQGGIGNVFLHPHQFMPQMFHGAAAIDSALLMPFGAAVNVPLTVANLSSIPMPVAPPPPPPVTTFTTIPKRTNDETLTEMDISPQTSGREHKKENGQSDDGDKVKLRGDADREMKKALTPYFKNKKITKEEYKSLMKRGVYKLIKRGKPVTTEAATKLAMNYVFELTNHR